MYNKLIKNKLDQIGNGFCLAKWTNSTMHLGIGKNHSCHHPWPHIVPVNELSDPSALHNSSYKKQQRKKMLEGNRPDECSYCWKIEDSGNEISDRILMSGKFDSIFLYNKISKSNFNDNFNPTYLEVSFSNVCNFACAYCGPQYSSKWYSEILSKGSYINDYNKIHETPYLDREFNPYVEAFWKYFPEVYSNLKNLRITGGEPTLSRHIDKMFDYIKHNPNKKMNLTINTNLGLSKNQIDDLIKKLKSIKKNVKQIHIATSGESHGEKANYVRDGINYSDWYLNCQYLLKEIPQIKLHIMCAYNIFCITSFTDFLKDIKNLKKANLSVSYITTPSFMSASNAPIEWIAYLNESLEYLEKNFNKEAVNRFKHVISHFNNKNKDELLTLQNFILEFDRRRSKDFKKVFPEYKFIWNTNATSVSQDHTTN
jgi:organic radical activating enzyme